MKIDIISSDGIHASEKEALERMRSVTAEDVQTLAKELASRDRTIVRVGPFGR